MYGGKPDTLCIETRDKQSFFIDWTPPDFLRLFHKEFQQNSTTLLSLDEFKTYMKDNRNPLGTGMSLLAQDIERQIISIAIQTFNQNEYTTGTIIHDGFLVESLAVKDEVLRKAEQAVKSSAIYLSGNRLGRLMKQWGYTTEKKGNSKGWCGIHIVKNYLTLSDY